MAIREKKSACRFSSVLTRCRHDLNFPFLKHLKNTRITVLTLTKAPSHLSHFPTEIRHT